MKPRIISLAGCVVALTAACTLLVATAATAAKPATSSKPYSLVLAPATVPGGSTATITATYTNLTDQQQLGSSNLTPPADFTVVSAQITSGPAGATASVAGGTVELRNLSTAPGGSVTVSMQVETSCGGGQGTWTAVTKQANDFNGPPGNNLALDASKSSLTTTATGGCQLSFTTQPKDVQVGSTITGTAGDPAGPPVAVSVLDAAGNPTKAEISVTVGLGTKPSGAVLNGTKTLTSDDGVATFSTLSVNAAGTYTLVATSPDATSDTSDVFRAYLTLVPCINNVFCTATATTGGTVNGNRRYTNSVNVDAPPNPDGGVANDGGTLALSYNSGVTPVCDTYDPVSPDTEVVVGPNRVKTVTSTIDRSVMDARRRAASSLRTCLIAPYQFRVGLASGNAGLATPIGDPDGDGVQDFSGILPQCNPSQPNLPCQQSATADSLGNGIVVYLLPADPRDPLGRH